MISEEAESREKQLGLIDLGPDAPRSMRDRGDDEYGDMGVAGELRLRAAKFGVTPEDRARLRIQIVVADKAEAEAEATAHRPSSRDRYTTPQAV